MANSTPEEHTPALPRSRPGGRSARVVRDVVRATIDELARGGYARLRIEEVAARAGVNKTTVYRRWPTKEALVREALRAVDASAVAPPDTGSVARDLLACARDLVRRVSTPEGALIVRTFSAEWGTPEVRELGRPISDRYRAMWRGAIERGIARGELPPGTDAALVTEVVTSALLSRLLRGEAPLDDAFASATIELVLRGATAGGAVRPPRPAPGRRPS